MKMTFVGEELDAFVISDKKAGRAKVVCSPRGFEEYLGSRSFTILHRYLYSLPFYIVIRDRYDEGTPPSLKQDGKLVYGPIIVFGYDDAIRSLTDFEYTAIVENVSMEKYQGECILMLNNVLEKPEDGPVAKIMD